MAGAFQLRRFLHPGAAGGVITNVTAALKTWGKARLATSTALTTINGIPNGNAVTLTQSVSTPIELTCGGAYTTGDAVIGAPSGAYTGALESGYTAWTEDGNARTMTPDNSAAQGNGTGALGNETRTTGKPILQLFTIPNQRFTGKLVLMFASKAHSGVSKLRIYVEGAVTDLTGETWYRYVDVNGLERWFYGWICELDAANYTSFSTDAARGVRVYARSYAVDGTLQTQLFGVGTSPQTKMLFYPALAAHDYLIQVTPSAIADSKPNGAYPAVNAIFRKLEDATLYLAGVTTSGFTIASAAKAPRIEVTENCSLYPVSNGTNYSGGAGFCTVTAAAGITDVKIGRASWDASIIPLGSGVHGYEWRTGYWGMEFRGTGIVLDGTYMTGVPVQNNTKQAHWGNGCRVRSDIDYGTYLGPDKLPPIVPAFPYTTDCDIDHAPGNFGLIMRNNVRRKLIYDLYDGTNAVFGERLETVDTSAFATGRDAFDITYSGAGTGAIQKVGNNGNSGSFILKVNAAAIDTLVSPANLADVVTWVNTHANWSATLLATPNDNLTDRYAGFMTAAGTTAGPGNGFSANLTTGVAYRVTTFMDLHLDFWQWQSITYTNKYLSHVQGFGIVNMQGLFVDGDATDIYFGDTFLSMTFTQAIFAQVGSQNISHFIIENFSDPFQTLQFNNGATWTAGGNLANFTVRSCVFAGFQWQTNATATALPVLTDCHFIAGYSNQGSQVAVNISTGGSTATCYPNATSKDIAPGSTLTTAGNLITPYTASDLRGIQRVGATPKGASTPALASGTLTKTQALQLAAVTANDSVGTAVGTATLSWKAGASETGATNQLVISFDVAV